MNVLRSAGILVLGALAAFQLTLLLRGTPTDPVVGIGSELPALIGADPTAPPLRWSESNRTVLLVFHSECGFSDAVAADWRQWLAEHPTARTVLVSRDSPEAAAVYAGAHDWPDTVLTVEPKRVMDFYDQLTSKTPWIYVVDRDGRLVHQSHGAQLALLAEVLNHSGGR